MSNDNENFQEIQRTRFLLAALREVSGLTQTALAQSAGISAATIAKIEAKNIEAKNIEAKKPPNMPRPETIKSILEVYKLSDHDFRKAIDELKSMGLTPENAMAIAEALSKKPKSADDSLKSQVNVEDLNKFDDASYFEKLVDFAGRIPFVSDAVAAYFSMRDPKTSLAIKATLASALVYFVSPIDVIPDVVPILGLTDDAGVVMAAVALAGSAITSAHRKRANQLLTKMNRDTEDHSHG